MLGTYRKNYSSPGCNAVPSSTHTILHLSIFAHQQFLHQPASLSQSLHLPHSDWSWDFSRLSPLLHHDFHYSTFFFHFFSLPFHLCSRICIWASLPSPHTARHLLSDLFHTKAHLREEKDASQETSQGRESPARTSRQQLEERYRM